jgi:hypothetical protein
MAASLPIPGWPASGRLRVKLETGYDMDNNGRNRAGNHYALASCLRVMSHSPIGRRQSSHFKMQPLPLGSGEFPPKPR